ncbi:MAG: hypothetical protein P3X22_003000 [Thermoprotei archaeon]|nr:hypothetical protein [Thermoprotei archaeon]
MKLQTTVPTIVLGLPIPGSINPYIAVPTAPLEVDVSLEKCRAPHVKLGSLRGLEGLISRFWETLMRGLGMEFCGSLNVIRPESLEALPLGGLYASITSSLVYALSKAHGEHPRPGDVVELSKPADPFDVDESWALALEALRYSSTAGKPVAYRGVLEVYEFRDFTLKAEARGRAEGVKPRVSPESIGHSLYGALIHLAGSMVLEASIMLREGARPLEVLEAYKPLHEGLALAVWGLTPGSGRCMWIPSIPGSFELVCVVA